MATKAENTTEQKAKFSITRKIMELFNLGDSGKLDSFFTRVTKSLNRDITALETNKRTIRFNAKQREDELKDQLEDAQDSLQEAYLAVSPEDVKTNEDQKSFMDFYLKNIHAKRDEVKRIEELIKAHKEELAANIKSVDDRINSRKEDIEAISATK